MRRTSMRRCWRWKSRFPLRPRPRPRKPPPRALAASPRFVNTWFEDDREPVLPLEVGRPYRLGLNIGGRRQEEKTQSERFVEPDFGGHDQVRLVVSLYSEDFEIEAGSRQLALVLPRV